MINGAALNECKDKALWRKELRLPEVGEAQKERVSISVQHVSCRAELGRESAPWPSQPSLSMLLLFLGPLTVSVP